MMHLKSKDKQLKLLYWLFEIKSIYINIRVMKDWHTEVPKNYLSQ